MSPNKLKIYEQQFLENLVAQPPLILNYDAKLVIMVDEEKVPNMDQMIGFRMGQNTYFHSSSLLFQIAQIK